MEGSPRSGEQRERVGRKRFTTVGSGCNKIGLVSAFYTIPEVKLGEVTLKVLNHIDPERDIQFHARPGRFPRPRLALAKLWFENGHRRHPQVG